MSEKVKERIDYITFLQSFAVTLVMIGHSLPNLNGTTAKPDWAMLLYHFVYTFHMPLFFVIAGFLLSYSFAKNSNTIKSFYSFIKSKFVRIIVPYIGLGTLSYFLKVFIFNKFAYRVQEAGIIPYLKSLMYPETNPNGYLWFLPTIFVILIICYFIGNKTLNYKHMLFSFLIAVSSLFINIKFLNISGILYNQVFFISGMYLFQNKDKILNFIRTNKVFILAVFLLFIFLYYCKVAGINILPNILAKIFVAFAGIILSIFVAINFSQKDKKFMWGFFDGKYYQLYLLSWYYQCGIRVFYQLNLVDYKTVCILMFIFGSILLPMLTTKIIEKFLPKLKIFIGL